MLSTWALPSPTLVAYIPRESTGPPSPETKRHRYQIQLNLIRRALLRGSERCSGSITATCRCVLYFISIPTCDQIRIGLHPPPPQAGEIEEPRIEITKSVSVDKTPLTYATTIRELPCGSTCANRSRREFDGGIVGFKGMVPEIDPEETGLTRTSSNRSARSTR